MKLPVQHSLCIQCQFSDVFSWSHIYPPDDRKLIVIVCHKTINNMVVSLITRSQLHSRLNIFNENVSYWFLHVQIVQSGNQTKEYSLIPKYLYKFKFFINKESSIRNMHLRKNAQMTRTNKRIKQGNTRKIIKKNNNNTTIVPEGVITKYL